MQALIDALERLPVATVIHLIVAAVLGVDLIVNGKLSTDALTYAGIVEGGNGLVGLGRAHIAAAKVVASVPTPDDGGPVADVKGDPDDPEPINATPIPPQGE